MTPSADGKLPIGTAFSDVALSFGNSGKLRGDVPSATAILDRILHRAELVQISGKSYRLDKSVKSSKSTKAPTGSPTES